MRARADPIPIVNGPTNHELNRCRKPSRILMTGQEKVKIMAYADDVSHFVRDARSLHEFRRIFSEYSEVSGAAINQKSKVLLFGSSPLNAIGDIQKVDTAKVLSIYFTYEGVAQTTWNVALE
ncbi:hypothetical protein HPB50_019673 [Hyalomma asiaticum]|uniref:Uncharacterized protein n=1 Tax=Hyalomma asiaticum TaxID=266040 RepID=A0ACB7SA66_HYAAI|nr:hypothetical protein HPB50_019673 [Hyalomma asiaticum]